MMSLLGALTFMVVVAWYGAIEQGRYGPRCVDCGRRRDRGGPVRCRRCERQKETGR